MTSFTEMLASLAPRDDHWIAEAGEDWRQGRTVYGGGAAALCLEATLRALAPAAPLRSAQISFIGPATDNFTLHPVALRRGKSATFAGCDLVSDGQIATRTVFCFGEARPSAYTRRAERAPHVPGPDQCGAFFGERRPTFAQHFETRLAAGSAPVSGGEPDITLWARHRDAAAVGPSALLALADVPPPAAFSAFTAPAMISTMTWMIDVLDPAGLDSGGWRLMRSTAETIADGYSAQAMWIWTAEGAPLIAGRQSIAVFG